MFSSSSKTTTFNTDSKYSVADILTSMANGDPLTPYSEPGPSYASTVTSLGTPILTPTTLANIEATFIELTNVPPTTSSSARAEVADLSRTSGFVPPVVDPVTSSSVMTLGAYSDDSSGSDWSQPSTKRARYDDLSSGAIVIAPATPGGLTASGQPRRTPGPRRSRRDEKLTPEEERRRQLRRERNKLAAAKCRQRRVDQTNTLVGETELLEEEKASLENEIESLTQMKEHLTFVLEAHQPVCSKCVRTDIDVKVETTSTTSATTSAVLSASGLLPPVNHVMARPTTLSLASRTVPTTVQPARTTSSVTEATGITISTPSAGVTPFGTISFDGIVDGHTGLTPLTGAPSCGSELHRSSSDSSPGENLHSPTLISLSSSGS